VVTPTDPNHGLTVTVPAAMGFPPVFYQQGSVRGAELRAYLLQQGYTDGYHWDYPAAAGDASETPQEALTHSAENRSAVLDYVLPLSVVLLLVLAVASVHAVRTLRSGTAEGKLQLQEAQERLLPVERNDAL
jgi:hypothetical protein